MPKTTPAPSKSDTAIVPPERGADAKHGGWAVVPPTGLLGADRSSPLSPSDIPPCGGNLICIAIYYSPVQRKIEYESVDVPKGTSLGDLLSKAMPARLAEAMASQGLTTAVWGRAVGMDYVLQQGDRLELVRDLRVDPMTARRERFAKQGAKKKAGLFKTKRVGAKAGY